MPAFNAIGMDAVGTAVLNSSVGSASLSCSISATSSTSASLTTTIRFAATLAAATILTAALTSSNSNLNAALASSAIVTASLTTTIRLQAGLVAQNVVLGDLTSTQVLPMFTPSLARTINVQATSPIFVGGKWWTLTDPKKPRGLKDPAATIDITFDWSNWLDDISADPNNAVTISDVTFTLNGVSSVGSFSDGTKVTVFVSGGTAGTATTVACKITTLTTPQRTDERTVYIDIAEE